MKERISERIEFLGHAGEVEAQKLIDLSSTGAAIIHTKEKNPGNIVKVKIQNLNLEASVIYCRPRREGFRLGINFRNVPQEIKNKLVSIVEEFSRGVPIKMAIIEDDKKEA